VWTSAGSSTYYLQKVGGLNPRISLPVGVYELDSALTQGTLGALTASQWAYGDNNSLGYNTIYVRLSDGAAPTNNEISVSYAKLGVNISNCRFEQLGGAGIFMRSGGSLSFPGHARIIGCAFSRCAIGVLFTNPLGNVVMACSFQGCDIDVETLTDTSGLRCIGNIHLNTNPRNDAAKGAYLISVPTGASDKRIWQITDCTFRNVKNMHVMAAGNLVGRLRMLIWRDNDVDTLSTGLPSGFGVITALTSAQKILGQNTIAPTGGDYYESGDFILHSDPAVGEEIGFMGTGTGFGNVRRIQAQAHYLSGAGTPSSTSASATFIGQRYFDTTNAHFYIATATGTGGWKQITA
jgi:hypothetical protein